MGLRGDELRRRRLRSRIVQDAEELAVEHRRIILEQLADDGRELVFVDVFLGVGEVGLKIHRRNYGLTYRSLNTGRTFLTSTGAHR